MSLIILVKGGVNYVMNVGVVGFWFGICMRWNYNIEFFVFGGEIIVGVIWSGRVYGVF